jgi:hypothetical protein
MKIDAKEIFVPVFVGKQRKVVFLGKDSRASALKKSDVFLEINLADNIKNAIIYAKYFNQDLVIQHDYFGPEVIKLLLNTLDEERSLNFAIIDSKSSKEARKPVYLLNITKDNIKSYWENRQEIAKEDLVILMREALEEGDFGELNIQTDDQAICDITRRMGLTSSDFELYFLSKGFFVYPKKSIGYSFDDGKICRKAFIVRNSKNLARISCSRINQAMQAEFCPVGEFDRNFSRLDIG